jgi:hypothetical protein
MPKILHLGDFSQPKKTENKEKIHEKKENIHTLPQTSGEESGDWKLLRVHFDKNIRHFA